MGSVERCVESDVPALADLHCEVFYEGRRVASDGLRRYYREVFFGGPWRDPDCPSFVYRNLDGRLTGFIGCVPRRMQFDGSEIRVVVLHRLMVSRESDSSMPGLDLLKRVYEGSQELTFSDGVNDQGRAIEEFAGASTSWLYSTNWIRPLRPTSFLIGMLSRRSRGFRSIAWLLEPAARALDWLMRRLRYAPLALDGPETLDVSVDASRLADCLSRFSRSHRLRPIYDADSMGWLLDFLHRNDPRGELKGSIVTDARGTAIGAFLYYIDAFGIAEVMLLSGEARRRGKLLKHLLHHAAQAGAVGIGGRVEPRFLPELWEQGALLKGGDWAMVHARLPAIAEAINAGDAFLSALEGELWLRGPRDGL